MISLNLLPPERKEIFRWRQYIKKVILNGSRSIFLLFCFSVSFFAINIYLLGEINILNAQIDSYNKAENIQQINSIEKSFKDINSALVKIDKISDQQISWIDIFEKLTLSIPPNVQIFSLQIDPDGGLMISGNAKTRNDVLEFGKNLKSSPDFSSIQTPLDNLIKSEDIDFKFSGKVILDNFRSKGGVKK